jgi:hypothetical protein
MRLLKLSIIRPTLRRRPTSKSNLEENERETDYYVQKCLVIQDKNRTTCTNAG